MKIKNILVSIDVINNYCRLVKNAVITKFQKGHHQMSQSTEYDRYPKIFTVCKEYSVKKFLSKEFKILSFGCSTGEECFTLRKYFPSAKIFGVDINKRALGTCEKRNRDPNIFFMYNNFENIKEKGPFDIIFCMSVLCRWPETKYIRNIANIYNFSMFENVICKLDKVLVENGLLVIYNSNFVFSDTSIYCKYGVLDDLRIIESGFVQKFDKNNNKIKESGYKECIFIKEVQNR